MLKGGLARVPCAFSRRNSCSCHLSVNRNAEFSPKALRPGCWWVRGFNALITFVLGEGVGLELFEGHKSLPTMVALRNVTQAVLFHLPQPSTEVATQRLSGVVVMLLTSSIPEISPSPLETARLYLSASGFLPLHTHPPVLSKTPFCQS